MDPRITGWDLLPLAGIVPLLSVTYIALRLHQAGNLPRWQMVFIGSICGAAAAQLAVTLLTEGLRWWAASASWAVTALCLAFAAALVVKKELLLRKPAGPRPHSHRAR